MIPRRFVLTLSLAACVAMLWAIAFRHRQVVHLRAEQKQKLANAAIAADAAPASPVGPSQSVSREVLQLRNQVAQLRRQRDELFPVRAEHEQLVVQVAARGTNASALPPNYIRKAQARLVGYNSPEATLQSFLYAIRTHDLSNFFQAFTPEGVARLKSRDPQFFERTLAESQALIGLSIISREQLQPDYIQTSIQLLPGVPPTPIYFHLINNQWKMDQPPW